MPTIIDTSIFTGELFIPNTMPVPDIQGGSGAPGNSDKLTHAIEKYERLLLVNALGIVQYNELMANLAATSGKWYDLINGKTYGDKRFEGIKNIIAYNVYYNFLKYDVVQYTTVGLEKPNAKNSTNILPNDRLVDFWNTFVVMYQYVDDECSGWFWWPFNIESRNTFVSLFQFLHDNKEDYDVTFFKFYRMQNLMGI